MQENANAFVNKWVNFGGEHAAVHANNFRFKRQIYFRLEKYLREFLDGKPTQRLVVMPGLRGTGKTVVMHQLHTWLRKEYLLPPHRVVYMPLDEARMFGVGLKEAFGVYEKYHLGGSALCTKDRVVLFIDEVHYDPGWALAAKTIHDYAPNVFLLITGSAALDLALSPDIARRARIERI
ncbi:MAG: AAA family ATPase, partial [Thermoplasmata archaeon]